LYVIACLIVTDGLSHIVHVQALPALDGRPLIVKHWPVEQEAVAYGRKGIACYS
jgi:hypothetical protein